MKQNLDNEMLKDVRSNTNWRNLFCALEIQKDEKKSNVNDWWGFSPFDPGERTASFHINDNGWYCHSSNQGGGVIELVQRVKRCDCYSAGRWLLEHNLSHIQADAREGARGVMCSATEDTNEGARVRDKNEEEKENVPIRQDLRPLMSPAHVVFQERGISVDALEELGIGYYAGNERSRSPLKGRLIFQIRGVQKNGLGELEPTILSHVGRATTDEQERVNGVWHIYDGFHASNEVYNQDMVLLDEEAKNQTRQSGRILMVEGCFDVAKLYSGGVRNVIATFGGEISEKQLLRLKMISDELGVNRYLVFFDRHRGSCGEVVEKLNESGFEAKAFDWSRRFRDRHRGQVAIGNSINDPCEFSVEQLRWLRRWDII